MRPIVRASLMSLVIFAGLLLVQRAFNRATGYKPKDPGLFQTIQHMDSVMFDAFNKQDLETLKTLFSDSLEFYHDIGGVSNYAQNIEAFQKLFAANTAHPLRRQLLPNSLEVYAIPGFGAVEMGLHRFIHKENGKDVIGLFKFVHTWQLKEGKWKVARVVSVGH